MFGYAKEVLEDKINELSEENKKKDSQIAEYDKRLSHINSFDQLNDKIGEDRIGLITGTVFGTAFILASSIAVPSSKTIIGGILGWGCIYLSVVGFNNIKNAKIKLQNKYNDLLDMSKIEIKEQKDEYVSKREKCHLDSYKIQSQIVEYSKLLAKINEYKDILKDIDKDAPLYLADSKAEYDLLLSFKLPKTEEEQQENLTETSKEFIKRFPKM